MPKIALNNVKYELPLEVFEYVENIRRDKNILNTKVKYYQDKDCKGMLLEKNKKIRELQKSLENMRSNLEREWDDYIAKKERNEKEW